MSRPVTRQALRSEPLEPELDAFCLARAQRREPAACRALVQRHQRLVFAILSRMLAPAGRLDRLEDLAQEVFLRVFGALADFEPEGPARLSTWIGTIASRVAIDELRRRAARPVEPAVAQEQAAMERAVEDARLGQLRRGLQRALADLEPEARALFVLRAYHGWSHLELAVAFTVPVGTIKSRLSRIRRELRKALAERVEVPDEH